MNNTMPMNHQPAAIPSRRHPALRAAGWLVALVCLLVLAGIWQASLEPMAFDVVIDGEEFFSSADSSVGERFAWIAAACVLGLVGALIGLAVMGVIVPIVLLAVAAAVFVALIAGLGLPVLVVALVVAIVMSPFLLIGWLLWKLAT